MIQVEHISKTFQVSRRNAGFSEAFKALIHKEYECIKALDDISFTIKEGEMVGYIGPNGAGKSSTIKVLSGILTLDQGNCIINGKVPWKERTAHVREIGVVFGQRTQLWWDVPVIDFFELLRDIYRIPTQTYHNNLEERVTLLQLEQIIRTPARQLSLGQRMRCEIAASFLHSPKILFIIYASICFFTLEGLEFMNVLTDGAREYGKYPLNVYGKGVLRFCTYLVPYALFQYDPFLYLIGRTDHKSSMFLPILDCLFVLPCFLLWHFGVRHYQSTGS